MSQSVTQESESAVRGAQSHVIPGVSKSKAMFMLAAGISFVLSVSLFFGGSQEQGIFVGIWVPSILSAGTLLMGGNGNE